MIRRKDRIFGPIGIQVRFTLKRHSGECELTWNDMFVIVVKKTTQMELIKISILDIESIPPSTDIADTPSSARVAELGEVPSSPHPRKTQHSANMEERGDRDDQEAKEGGS